jgi:hypothetical protein
LMAAVTAAMMSSWYRLRSIICCHLAIENRGKILHNF